MDPVVPMQESKKSSQMQDWEFQKRNCPLCNSTNRKTLIQVNGAGLVAANWSYQREMFDDLGLSDSMVFPIEECTDCGFIYAGLMPPRDFLDWVYDRLIDIEGARREAFSSRSVANRMDYLTILIRLLEWPGRILDFGCGFGATLALLRNIEGMEVIGFDTSPARVQELKVWHPTVVDNLEALRIHGPFAAVILDNVLEHVPDLRRTLAFIGEICAEGAVLYVSVPDVSRRYLRAQIGLNRQAHPLSMDINPWEHLNYFDLPHLDHLLGDAGFVALRQTSLSGEVRIGLRPEVRLGARIKNSLASLMRLFRYALRGNALGTANLRFYRYRGETRS